MKPCGFARRRSRRSSSNDEGLVGAPCTSERPGGGRVRSVRTAWSSPRSKMCGLDLSPCGVGRSLCSEALPDEAELLEITNTKNGS